MTFPAPYGPVLTKISKYHIFFLIFGKSLKKEQYIHHTQHIYHKVWLKIIAVREVAF